MRGARGGWLVGSRGRAGALAPACFGAQCGGGTFQRPSPAISCLGAFPTPASERVADLVIAGVRKPAQQPPLAEVSKRATRRNFWRSETVHPLNNWQRSRVPPNRYRAGSVREVLQKPLS